MPTFWNSRKQQPTSPNDGDNHEAILEATLHAAQRLLDTVGWETVLEDIFARLGNAADVSRVYLFTNERNDDGALIGRLVSEWVAPGISDRAGNPVTSILSYEAEGFTRWMKILSDGGEIAGNTAEFPTSERVLLTDRDTISIAVVPVFVGDVWWGFLAFDECRGNREWQKDTIAALHSSARVLAGAIRREQMEAALRASHQRFLTVIDNLDGCVYVADPNTDEIIYANRAMRNIFGDIVGATCWKVLREDSEGHCANCPGDSVFDDDSTTGGLVVTEVFNSKTDRTFEIHCQAIPWMDGRIVRLETAFDITERKIDEAATRQLETQLQQTSRQESLGLLASGLAHDFNNLLMGIMGNANLARMDVAESSPLTPRLNEIIKASQRAADLTNQILAYGGKSRFVVEKVNINDVITDAWQVLESSISRKIRLVSELSADVLPVRADASQITQVIVNLVTNATESMDREEIGVITIASGLRACDREYLSGGFLGDRCRAGDYVCIDVTDTGCGMEKEAIEHVFDPFYSSKFAGRGLGLAATMGIIRGHTGAIRIRSAPGQGSRFRVMLPATTAVETSPVGGGSSDDLEVSTGGVILLVDDEEYVRTTVRALLKHGGFAVLTATDGNEAIRLFKMHAERISCVLLDLTMPIMDGVETLKHLRAIDSETPIIISSGYREEAVAEQFDGLGMTGFIQKPYEWKSLQQALREVLSK